MYVPLVLNPSFFGEREEASSYTRSPRFRWLFFSGARASNASLYAAWALPRCCRTFGMRALRSSTYCSAAELALTGPSSAEEFSRCQSVGAASSLQKQRGSPQC